LMETNETYRQIALSQLSEEELKQEGSDSKWNQKEDRVLP
jgi:hypothetical protein